MVDMGSKYKVSYAVVVEAFKLIPRNDLAVSSVDDMVGVPSGLTVRHGRCNRKYTNAPHKATNSTVLKYTSTLRRQICVALLVSDGLVDVQDLGTVYVQLQQLRGWRV